MLLSARADYKRSAASEEKNNPPKQKTPELQLPAVTLFYKGYMKELRTKKCTGGSSGKSMYTLHPQSSLILDGLDLTHHDPVAHYVKS